MNLPMLFTHDFHLVPSTVQVSKGVDGIYRAFILRECFDCEGTGQLNNSVCPVCGGLKTIGPTQEVLTEIEDVSVFERVLELKLHPALDSWKKRHAVCIELLNQDSSKFATGIKEQLTNGMFLTSRQLDSFLKTFNPMNSIGSQSDSIEVPPHQYNVGDTVKIKICFSECRVSFSKYSNGNFFTFTGMTSYGGFAVTNKCQSYVSLGKNYMVMGRVRRIYPFENKPFAVLTVDNLNLLD